MNGILARQMLISDNPEYDGGWLGQVSETAGAAPTFEISDISADALIAAAADKFGILDLEYTFPERETARLSTIDLA